MELMLRISAFLASLRVTQSKIIDAVQELNIQTSSNLEFSDRRAVRVSAVQYKMKPYATLKEFVQDLNGYVDNAVKTGAQLVVFPENIAFSALSLVPLFDKVEKRLGREDKAEALGAVADIFDDYLYEVYSTLFSQLAMRHRIYIAAGSAWIFQDDEPRNRAHLFGPAGGELAVQDKLFPSGDEIAAGMEPGDRIDVTETSVGHLAMLVGQDDEYYEPFKIAALSGADLIALSASCLGAQDPFRTVSAAAARAYEYNVFCVRAAMVGRFITGEVLKDRAAIYAPYTCSREEHGVMAIAESDSESCIVSTRLDYVRLEGAPNQYNSHTNDSTAAQYGAYFKGEE